MKKKHSEVAGIFAKHKPPAIIAHPAKMLGPMWVAAYHCADTGNTVVMNEMPEPVSPITGGSVKHVAVANVKKSQLQFSAEDISLLTVIARVGDGKKKDLVIRAVPELAKALDGKTIYSPYDGKPITVKAEFDSEDDVDDSITDEVDSTDDDMEDVSEAEEDFDEEFSESDFDEDDEDSSDGDDMSDDSDEDSDSEDDEDDMSDDSDDSEEDVVDEDDMSDDDSDAGDDSSDDAGDDAGDSDDDAGDNISEDDDMGDDDSSDDDMSDDDSDDSEDDESDDEEDMSDDSDEDSDDEDEDLEAMFDDLSSAKSEFLIETAAAHTEIDNISAALVGDKMWIIAGDTPIATAEKAACIPTVAKIFNNPAVYSQALASTIAKETLNEEVIANFGMTLLETRIPVEASVKNEISREVAKIEKTVDGKVKAGIDKFNRATSVAAVGINKGTFDGVKNPLYDTVIAELTALGADDAAQIADRIFKNSGEQYAKVLLAQASELASETDESLANYARLVKRAAFVGGGSDFGVELSRVGIKARTEKEVASAREDGHQSALQRRLNRLAGR